MDGGMGEPGVADHPDENQVHEGEHVDGGAEGGHEEVGDFNELVKADII